MDRNEDKLNSSVQYLKGVGPKRSKIFNKLGVYSVGDLLYYLPRRYEDRSNLKPISQVKVNTFETVRGKVLTMGLRRTRKKLSVFELAVGDEGGFIYGVWFNQPFLKDRFKIGDEVILSGKVELYKHLQMNTPEYEILDMEDEDTIHTARVVPIYPLTRDLYQRSVRILMKNCLDTYLDDIEEVLPEDIIKKHKLIGLKKAILNIHFPKDMSALEPARQRLVFDEFFFLQLGIGLHKLKIKTAAPGISHTLDIKMLDNFEKGLPFKLTAAQKKVIARIKKDMASDKPMNRLLQGDVGSGKTIVCVFSLLTTIGNGHQAAVMVPTEILAEQHYLTLSKLLMPLGLNIIMLVSGLRKKARQKILDEISSGQAHIIVGTHAVIQQDVEFKKLGLIVVDEQHKFGVLQRADLRKKGVNPDVLVMTATPIPRTLALTVYGDLDISVIDQMPPGRREVKTYWVSEKKRQGLYDFIKKEVVKGRQAFIVYALVEESEKLDLKAAVGMQTELQNNVFKDLKVGLLHGRMSGSEKEEVMKAFRDGEYNILVSTTVIEVGIDIPNASIMFIENAERFGLSQLHQLRGRIGRGRHESYCILMSAGLSEDGKKRLSAMTRTSDGFKIAEYDLSLRGPGEFFGTRQHGLPELKIANLVTDIKVLEMAQQEAFDLIKRDPGLSSPEYALIKEQVKQKFKGKLELLSVS
ncbi:MAG: ATP-dependent DNA helicase RecG [Candidatus Omnitrophica bacterium]|nr:ATP-dependent DNA helicase RecG [Candidatus Omnitrophota bacterium]